MLRRLTMKTRIPVFWTVVILLLSFQNVYSRDLVLFDRSTDQPLYYHEFYYDKDSIVSSSGKIRVWTTGFLTDEGREFANKENSDIDPYKQLFYDEINCKERKYRTLKAVSYDKNGNSMVMFDNPDGKFNSISPNTMIDRLFKTLCKQKKKGK